VYREINGNHYYVVLKPSKYGFHKDGRKYTETGIKNFLINEANKYDWILEMPEEKMRGLERVLFYAITRDIRKKK